MERLLKILEEIRPDIDFSVEKGLIDNDILNSMDIIRIVDEISDAFDIDISPNELVPRNFNSAQAIYDTIQRIVNE